MMGRTGMAEAADDRKDMDCSTELRCGKDMDCSTGMSSLGRYVFGSEISYNKPPPRLPGLGC
jgi:hypothetical protein